MPQEAWKTGNVSHEWVMILQSLFLPQRFNHQCFAHTKPVYLWVCQLKAPTMGTKSLWTRLWTKKHLITKWLDKKGCKWSKTQFGTIKYFCSFFFVKKYQYLSFNSITYGIMRNPKNFYSIVTTQNYCPS